MKVIKQKNNNDCINVFLLENEKTLSFTFAGNLDLYWTLRDNRRKEADPKKDYFTITKENYAVYKLFEELYYDIENIKIFDVEDDASFYTDSEEEKRKYLKEAKEQNEELKERCRLKNYSNYNELFDEKNKTITWYSDETSNKVSNYLKIIKEENIFKVEFHTQPYVEGYDRDFNKPGYIPIRFRNSGSSYVYFNMIFMRMYHKIQEVDDVNDIGHQIHIEEYLYGKQKVKKMK